MFAIVFIVISLEYDLDNMLEKVNDDHPILKMILMMRIRSLRGGENVAEKEGLVGGGDGRDNLRVTRSGSHHDLLDDHHDLIMCADGHDLESVLYPFVIINFTLILITSRSPV